MLETRRPRGGRFTLQAALLAVALAGTFAGQARSGASIPPGDLLIYYGWPSSINGTFTVPLAAAVFGEYDVVVFGDGLELASHPDHQNVVDILAHPETDNTTVFGYVDLGVSTQNLPMAEIEARVDAWVATGADGIFYDDFGYDFGVTRERQNEAVSYAHAQGMRVVANAWVPGDALGSTADATYNPAGAAPALDGNDYYLFESHQIIQGTFMAESQWRQKATDLEAYRDALGVGVLAITTNDAADAYDESKFFYAWYSALLYGYDAVGWGEYVFSADDAQAPHRARPALDPGTQLVSSVIDASPEYWRNTDTGRIWINTSTHAYGFDGTIVGVETASIPSRPVLELLASPSPFSASTTFRIDALAGSVTSVEAQVVDVTGRVVRTLDAPVASGALSVEWDGRNASGLSTPSGIYFVRVVLDDGRVARGRVMRVR